MTREQQPISNDVLAERISNFYEQNRTEFQALHHHLTEVSQKLDTYGDSMSVLRESLRDHMALQHHAGTRDELLRMAAAQLEMERAIGQLRDWQIKNDARTEERTTNISLIDRLWVTAMASVPTFIVLYSLLRG